jgi:hypothetical protein
MQLAFRNISKGGSSYRAKKKKSWKIWFFQNYCRTIYPMFLRTFFSKNDFVRETKIVPWEKNTAKVKQAPRKVTVLQMQGQPHGQRRQNTKFRTFYGKSKGQTNSIWPNKSVINNRTFFRDNFFEMLCMETNLYYFQNQGKYASSSKGLNGWMSVWQNWKKKCNNFPIVPLHKEEFFERYHSLKHY